MAKVNGMKSYANSIRSVIENEVEKEKRTHEETLRLRCDIQEHQRECDSQRDPQYDQSRNQPHQRTDWRQVPKRLRPQEPRERILLHRPEAILLLRMEHVRNLRHQRLLRRSSRLLRRAEWERVDAERGRKVDLVGVVRAG